MASNFHLTAQQRICSTIDEFAVNASGHNVQPIKIQPGAFNSYYTLIEASDFLLMIRQVEFKYSEAGEFKPGTIGLACLSDSGQVIYNGKKYTSGNRLVTLGQSLDSVLSTNLRMATCFINENRLEDFLTDEEQDYFYQGQQVINSRSVPNIPYTGDFISNLTLNIYNRVIEISNATIYNDLTEEIYSHFFNHVTQNTIRESSQITPKNRLRLFNQALEYINDKNINDVSVANLAKHIHCSQRNLQKLFQQYLDTSPKAYIQRKRLNHIHQQLLKADPEQIRVKDICVNNGIKHMGNFSRDYFEFYGEYPKDTLKRSGVSFH